MSARTPQQVHEQFVEAVRSHDLEGLMELYEPDAVLAPLSGDPPVRGREEIRKALVKLLATNPRDADIETVFCVQRDDLALMRSKWRFVGDGPDGRPVEVTGSGTEIMHRRPDGTWAQLIDNPLGGGRLV